MSYRVEATNLDGERGQSYRELVELVGIDEGPHEDGQNEVVAQGTIWDGIVTFSTSQVAFEQTREKNLPSSALDEDSGIFRADELRARVSLTPLPPAPVSRESNLVRRQALVFES